MPAQLQAALSELSVAMKSDLSAARSNVLSKCMFGLYTTLTLSPASVMTYLNTMELETDYLAVQIGIPNLHTAAIAGVKVSVANGDNFSNGTGANWLNDPTPTGSTGWHDCTFGGATSGTLAARVSGDAPSWTWFDMTGLVNVLRTGGNNGTLRPLLAVKVEMPSGFPHTVPANNMYGWRTDGLVHRPLRVSKQAVAGVTTPSTFTTTSSVDSDAMVFAVRYMTKKGGRQVMMSGDSTTEGTGGECRAMGAVAIASLGLSTPNDPVEYWNAGMHGNDPGQYSQNAINVLPFVRPHVFIYQPYSINSINGSIGLNASKREEYLKSFARVIQTAELHRAKMYILPTLPVNPGFRTFSPGSLDQLRRDFDTLLSQFTQVRVIADYAVPMTGAVDAGGQTHIPDGTSADDAHPNAATYTLMAAKVSPYIAAA